ncbi:heavy-metal-associated domain-containing protein [Clostridium sp. 'White wine YQ']|uniref:heavy-metal-associated domain-containing protein n=1 Tax=Clostridium sp. 'White wine YQ' TaxID=3027474 RepID=UPI00236724CD|nr:heavy-metal-associated domain-containing protein [Clostridium sp. 'White wine YQ']MDD7796390.1 heavy-metal-associated domain-containing protein [Clostridium sp. 'White wine YQ']
MKSSLRIAGMKTAEDVRKIKNAIASNQGVVACEISREKGEANIIYDDYFTAIDKIIDSVESLGYTVV